MKDPHDVTVDVLTYVLEERKRQDAQWGEQNHPDLLPRCAADDPTYVAELYKIPTAAEAKDACDIDARMERTNWTAIAVEELAEVVEQAALGDRAKTREELVQLAAVCVAWIEAIDRRK